MSTDDSHALVEKIKQARWWQGSVFSSEKLRAVGSEIAQPELWVIASQTCNIYNSCFEKVPTVELVGAKRIDKCEKGYVRGDQPRTIHVMAMGEGENVSLEIDIQTRLWLPRELLADLSFDYEITDLHREDPAWIKNQWLDNFSGWIARSYTRITLPDDFNIGLTSCRIKELLEKKLSEHETIYGIYFQISCKDIETYQGPLGLMPPPYNLEIWVVTNEDVNPKKLQDLFKVELFEKTLTFKQINQTTGDIESYEATRADSAKRNNLYLRPQAIHFKSVSEFTLLEAKSLVRYSMIDHLSDSTFASPP